MTISNESRSSQPRIFNIVLCYEQSLESCQLRVAVGLPAALPCRFLCASDARLPHGRPVHGRSGRDAPARGSGGTHLRLHHRHPVPGAQTMRQVLVSAPVFQAGRCEANSLNSTRQFITSQSSTKVQSDSSFTLRFSISFISVMQSSAAALTGDLARPRQV